MNFNQHIGLETAERAIFLRLFDFLNAAITEAEARWAASDEALADHMGQTYTPLEIEQIASGNFYEGHRPSLIKADIDKYPNVSVWGARTSPHPESMSSDHTNIFSNLVFIEVMCKAAGDEGEYVASKRLKRTCEAVNAVLFADPTLAGIMTGIEDDVVMSVSDVFTRKEKTSYGPVWFWQGARLEYTVRKDAVVAASAPGSNFRFADGMTAADMALIDQT